MLFWLNESRIYVYIYCDFEIDYYVHKLQLLHSVRVCVCMCGSIWMFEYMYVWVGMRVHKKQSHKRICHFKYTCTKRPKKKTDKINTHIPIIMCCGGGRIGIYGGLLPIIPCPPRPICPWCPPPPIGIPPTGGTVPANPCPGIICPTH